MRKIYKYAMQAGMPLRLNCVKLVRAGSDGGHDTPSIWVEHGREEVAEHLWQFEFYGTGHAIPNDAGDHLMSCRCGPYVWHIYGRII